MWIAQEVCAAAGKSTHSTESSWIINSGCSHQHTGCHKLFILGSCVAYRPGQHQIRIADNCVCGAAGYGDIMVNICNPGGHGVHAVTVHSILHMPGCWCNNLLSIGQLEELEIGFKIGMYKGVYHLNRNGIVVAEMDKFGGLYMLRTGGQERQPWVVTEDSKQEKEIYIKQLEGIIGGPSVALLIWVLYGLKQ